MKRFKIYTLLAIASIGFLACEDPIDVDINDGTNQLVVDGFLTSDSSLQTIRLTQSAPYFSNVRTPSENTVTLFVDGPAGVQYSFVTDNNGNYTYDPNTLGALDSVGFTYQLTITYNNKTYFAYSTLNPVPIIDSMTVAFEEEELGAEEGYYTQFYATDFAGRKDYYWIKAFRNNEPLFPFEPGNLNLSEDAAFGGEGADGFPFILPIRAAITDEEEPFIVGDISGVELWSMNSDAYQFLLQATVQANNDGLFSIPPANLRSNILDVTNNIQDEVLGVFSLSAVSRSEIEIK